VTWPTTVRSPWRASLRLASLCWLGSVACATPPGPWVPSRASPGEPARATDPSRSYRLGPIRTASPGAASSVTAAAPGVDACRALVRPGCAPRGLYGGSLDHFVALECSTLFDLGPELTLTGAPRPLVQGIALIEPSARTRPAFGPWATVDYTGDEPRAEPLALRPASLRLLAIVQEPPGPILLGKPTCDGKRCPPYGLWILNCERQCRQEHYLELRDAAELERIGTLGQQQRTVLTRELGLEAERRDHEVCVRSSVGCRDHGPPRAAPRPSKQLGPSWGLPNAGVRLGLEREVRGICLVRRTNQGVLLERWLLLSAERAEHMHPPHLTEPTRVSGGYLAFVISDGPGKHAALVRLDADGRLLGAPVRMATLESDVWSGGCADRSCLIAVSDGRTIAARVVRLTETTALPCESQSPVVYP
jgi:hypothetical protein